MSNLATNEFMGHPKGLFYLFFAELWERFSFYGMRALLVLYMTKQLLFDDSMSFGIYAAYMSMVYFTPIIGGILADQYLGLRRAIYLGGILMALGHFCLMWEHPIFFFGSLALIIVGNGFFKPNISTFVGKLYDKTDHRRDSGFTIFYMGINIGGAVAPLLCAWLAESYGWHFGFGLAGIGMLVGLLYFHRGIDQGIFQEKGLRPNGQLNSTLKAGWNPDWAIGLGTILSIPLFASILYYYTYEHYLIWIASAGILASLFYIYLKSSMIEQRRLVVIVYFTILMSIFWAIFEQAGSSLTLFADRNIRLIGMNAAQTNSINSGYIILLAGVFSWLWGYLDQKQLNPNSAIKSALGLILLGLGFVVFSRSAVSADLQGQTSMIYLLIGYFVLTIGELCISPIGLSKMTELSSPKYLSFIMGIFFTSSFYGHYFAGKIAQLTDVQEGMNSPFANTIWESVILWCTSLSGDYALHENGLFQQLYSYVSVYAVFGTIAIMIGIVALCLSPLIKRLMSGVH